LFAAGVGSGCGEEACAGGGGVDTVLEGGTAGGGVDAVFDVGGAGVGEGVTAGAAGGAGVEATVMHGFAAFVVDGIEPDVSHCKKQALSTSAPVRTRPLILAPFKRMP